MHNPAFWPIPSFKRKQHLLIVFYQRVAGVAATVVEYCKLIEVETVTPTQCK